MRLFRRYSWIALALLAALSSCVDDVPQRTQAKVLRVVDGDTIEVDVEGKRHTVRYIGVDTPESVDPRRPVEAYAKEASAKNRELVGGKTVTLEKDVSETDRYGRLLRYVYVDSLFVNAALVRDGYAQVSSFPPDVKHADYFRRLEKEAREEGRGLWAASQPTTTREAAPSGPAAATKTTATPTGSSDGGCDPAYPDFCIPPPPPDLDCKDVPGRRFRVLPPDPHRFDPDRDGIGCAA